MSDYHTKIPCAEVRAKEDAELRADFYARGVNLANSGRFEATQRADRLELLLKKATETIAGLESALRYRSEALKEQTAMIESLERTILHAAIAYSAEASRFTAQEPILDEDWEGK